MGEHIDKHLLERNGFGKEGNLYKAITSEANWDDRLPDGAPKPELWRGLEKKDGLPLQGEPGAFDDLEEAVLFTARASDETFRSELPTRFDLASYRDWWILVVATLALDSADKNSFHWHQPGAVPWTYVPWDFNASFGQNWNTRRERAIRPDVFADDNRLFARLLEDPTLAEPMKTRFGTLLRGRWQEAEVLALYDALVEETAPVASRDERRWLEAMRAHYGWPYERNVALEAAYTREWISDRWNYLLGEYP